MARYFAIVFFASCLWATEIPAADRPMHVGKAKVAMSEWSAQDLKPVTVPELDLVFVQRDARLDGYRKVMLGDVEVAVDRNWSAKTRTTTARGKRGSEKGKEEISV